MIPPWLPLVILAWASAISLYLACSVKFERAYQADVRRGQMEAFVAELQERYNLAARRIGEAMRPILVAFAQAVQGLHDAFVSIGTDFSKSVAWYAKIERRRNEERMLGMEPGTVDAILQGARLIARVTGESEEAAFDRAWEREFRRATELS